MRREKRGGARKVQKIKKYTLNKPHGYIVQHGEYSQYFIITLKGV